MRQDFFLILEIYGLHAFASSALQEFIGIAMKSRQPDQKAESIVLSYKETHKENTQKGETYKIYRSFGLFFFASLFRI